MVRMQIRGGIRWPKNIDFRYVPTPGRRSWGDLRKIIRLAKYGCANRPFYHIEVTKERFPQHKFVEPLEQVGTYDPLPNEFGEKLVSLNLERITYYLSQGVKIEHDVGVLLGLAGLLPQSPHTYKAAWRNRDELRYLASQEKEEESKESP